MRKNECTITDMAEEWWNLRTDRPYGIVRSGFTKYSQMRKYGPCYLFSRGEEEYSTVLRRFKQFKQEHGLE